MAEGRRSRDGQIGIRKRWRTGFEGTCRSRARRRSLSHISSVSIIARMLGLVLNGRGVFGADLRRFIMDVPLHGRSTYSESLKARLDIGRSSDFAQGNGRRRDIGPAYSSRTSVLWTSCGGRHAQDEYSIDCNSRVAQSRYIAERWSYSTFATRTAG